jgi:hypothetical protein
LPSEQGVGRMNPETLVRDGGYDAAVGHCSEALVITGRVELFLC